MIGHSLQGLQRLAAHVGQCLHVELVEMNAVWHQGVGQFANLVGRVSAQAFELAHLNGLHEGRFLNRGQHRQVVAFGGHALKFRRVKNGRRHIGYRVIFRPAT